jgi:hypothetical protein
MMFRIKRAAWLLVLILIQVVAVHAQESDPLLDAKEAMIPMRDGVRLYTQIYVPRVSSEPLPFLLLRTPYGTGRLDWSRIANSMPDRQRVV